MKTDIWLKIICAMQINAMLFGLGAITVLSIPLLNAHAAILIPAVVLMSFALSPLSAGLVARRMRVRNWGKTAWKRGDVISG